MKVHWGRGKALGSEEEKALRRKSLGNARNMHATIEQRSYTTYL
jgi:hypothetical protein